MPERVCSGVTWHVGFTVNFSTTLLLILAFIAANLPFLVERIFFVVAPKAGSTRWSDPRVTWHSRASPGSPLRQTDHTAISGMFSKSGMADYGALTS